MKSVVQFSTGNVGRHALQMIIERPDLELVGLHAHGADKIGRDAADLCGLGEPTGIIATDDIDALLALGPDCVLYTSQAETRPMQAIEEISRFLRAGINVVGTSMVWLVSPHHADGWLQEPLSAACRDGGAALYVNYCSGCHSLKYVRYSRIARDLGLTEDQVQASLNFTGSKVGEQMLTPIATADAQEWFGAVPPDLSVIARAKASPAGSGADYLYTYLRTFYQDETRPTGWNNMVVPNVAMPHAMWQQQGIRTAKFAEQADPHAGRLYARWFHRQHGARRRRAAGPRARAAGAL